MIKVLLYGIFIELCVCALILVHALGNLVPIYCLSESIPTWESTRCYLDQVDSKIIPELEEQLSHINDPASARKSVLRLMQLGDTCSDMYTKAVSYQEIHSESDFVDKAYHLIQQDEAHAKQASAYADALRHYKRLVETDFYGDRLLEATLHSYFFGGVEDDIIPFWLPTGMLRHSLSAHHLRVSKDSIAKLFSQVYDKDTTQDPREKDISLLFLDYCEHADIDSSGDFRLIAPAKPTIRGRGAIFDNCFCLNYCFHDRAPVSHGAASLVEMHSSALYSLNREQAKQLKEFIDESHDSKSGQAFLVFSLPHPFLSKYLILRYDDNAQNPSSMRFYSENPFKLDTCYKEEVGEGMQPSPASSSISESK